MSRPVTSEAGFSLVEVIAALAILSVAGLALMNAITQASRTGSFARDQALAQSAAETLLNLELIEIIQSGTLTEDQGRFAQAGIEYDWRLDVSPTSDPVIYQLDLTVSDPQGTDYTLTTFSRAGS